MRVIWKYPLELGENRIDLPIGFKACCVGSQYESMWIWIEQEENSVTSVSMNFSVFGTGHEIPPSAGEYVGSVQIEPYVWHVYQSGHNNQVDMQAQQSAQIALVNQVIRRANDVVVDDESEEEIL